ncbi:MAG: hypothetical protein IPL49_10365 [Saprospirales bacterium]|nr:hypothetical protein [Saprospirales bacterium]MBK8491269.1 hypothetical protein [Saprospirales bacterium]
MHVYHRFLLLSVFFLSLSFSTNAQPGRHWGTPEEMAEKQTAQMLEKLNLTEEQTVLVREINLANAIKVHKAREEAAGDFTKMRPLMQALRDEKNEHLKVVLTKKQFKKWEAIQAEQAANSRWSEGQHDNRNK